MNIQQTNRQGFTIIEVVLVLAIAALIFLMVFIALPALQRGQRDNARRSDASIVASSLNSYRTANRTYAGLATNVSDLNSYIDTLDQYDISSSPSPLITSSTYQLSPTVDQIGIKVSAQCPAEGSEQVPAPGDANITLRSGSSRQAAVVVLLENNGSQTQFYCVDV